MRASRRAGLCGAAVLLLACAWAWGDGMAFFPQSFRPIKQDEQRAAIIHRDGVERLVIAINLNLDEKEGAFWLFPVPGTPDATTIDVVDKFPEFGGDSPAREASKAINNAMMLVRATQLYPFLPEMLLGGFGGKAAKGGAHVHADVAKWGIRVQALTADSLDALAQHLAEQKLKVQKERLATFQGYLSDDYVLVAVWIASREEVLKKFPDLGKQRRVRGGRRPCLLVKFPSERPFYPLRATSGYGALEIPITVFVVGYYQVDSDPALAEHAQVDYGYRGPSRRGRGEASDEGFPKRIRRHTRIRLDTPAQNLVDDLWLAPGLPSRLQYPMAILSLRESWLGDAAVWLAIGVLSYVAAGLCGLILFRRWRGFAWLGLWNLLSVVGLAVAIGLILPRRGDDQRLSRTKAIAVCAPLGLLFLLPVGYILLALAVGRAEWALLGVVALVLAVLVGLAVAAWLGLFRGDEAKPLPRALRATLTFCLLFSFVFVLLSVLVQSLLLAPIPDAGWL